MIMGKIMNLNSGDTGYLSAKLLELLKGCVSDGSAAIASQSLAGTPNSVTPKTRSESQATHSVPPQLIDIEDNDVFEDEAAIAASNGATQIKQL